MINEELLDILEKLQVGDKALVNAHDEVLDLFLVSYCDCEDSHKITMTTRKCVVCKKLVNE